MRLVTRLLLDFEAAVREHQTVRLSDEYDANQHNQLVRRITKLRGAVIALADWQDPPTEEG